MSELKRFAVENKISVHLVAHQVTPQKDDNGRYRKPDVNSIKVVEHLQIKVIMYFLYGDQIEL